MKTTFLVFLFAISTVASATKYYVSSTSGDDATGRDGKSETTAWKTISRVNASTFLPGDMILFKRGDVWREILTVPSSGNSTSDIVFATYGTGANPKFLGSETTTWTNYSGNIWISAKTSTNPYGGTYGAEVFFENTDGSVTWGGHKTSIANLTAECNWTWVSNYIYVYATTDPNSKYTSVEIPQRIKIIDLNSKNYLHFDGINIFYSIQAGYAFGGWPQASQTGLIIENSDLGYIGTKNSEYAYGIDAGYSDMIVRHCEIYNCGRRAISFHLYGMGWTMRNVLIEDNYFHDGWHTTGPDFSVGSSGYYTASIDGVIVRRNRFYDPPTTTGFSELIFIQNSNGGVAGATLDNIYIYSNIFENSSNGGIHMETANGIYIYNNTFHNHNTSSPSNTFHLNISKVSPGYCTNIKVKNNIFYTTGTYSSSGNTPVFVKSGAIANNSDVDADYNIYYRINNSLRVIEIEYSANYHMDELAAVRSVLGWEAHGQFIDPSFTSANNYRLKIGSPALRKGTKIEIVKQDYDKKYFGVPPSIGAFEGKPQNSP